MATVVQLVRLQKAGEIESATNLLGALRPGLRESRNNKILTQYQCTAKQFTNLADLWNRAMLHSLKGIPMCFVGQVVFS